MISGPGTANPHIITVEELLSVEPPYCAGAGPLGARCMRAEHDSQLHAALGTDAGGRPVVVTWYHPDTTAWPLGATS